MTSYLIHTVMVCVAHTLDLVQARISFAAATAGQPPPLGGHLELDDGTLQRRLRPSSSSFNSQLQNLFSVHFDSFPRSKIAFVYVSATCEDTRIGRENSNCAAGALGLTAKP